MAARIAAALVLALTLAGSAHAATRPVSGAAPTGLKGFLLRADEPKRDVFTRTPSFAWNPVKGAIRYEFQLSTSGVFREGAIIYADGTLSSPAASVPLTLPWITGSPYSLYARVRAVLDRTITPWSKPFGFNMRWSTIAKPLPSYPGLLRWTPVEGARGYEVWFVDIPKIVTVYTNVVDQREFYTFHQGTQWISSVRWRIRALRWIDNKLANGLPVVSHGPWSPVYNSVNPPFSLGRVSTVATVSDVVSRGRASDQAHRLMPAFVFSGNQTGTGIGTDLYRVYVFTDRDCVNPVYKGALVGGPAYAPRPFGPLALPRSVAALNSARGAYLGDGDEGTSWAADFAVVRTTESDKPATPTTTTAAGQPAAGSSGSGSSSSTAPAATPPGVPKAPPQVVVDKDVKLGAPVDLWDTDWPQGGYYWTVIPVLAKQPPLFATTLGAVAPAGSTTITVANAQGLAAGDVLEIGPAPGEVLTVISVTGSSVTLSGPLTAAHPPGDVVERVSANLEYRELELTQEACAAGRVMRFGKTSEPALTSAIAPFVSGLSPSGRLMSASTRSPQVYGTPHVAWTPALGASVYEVQWSRTRYPFRAEPDPRGGSVGFMTVATSAILPLKPGTWWYRVRGINWSLPTGAQQMSWSSPAKVVVAKPRFRVVRRGR